MRKISKLLKFIIINDDIIIIIPYDPRTNQLIKVTVNGRRIIKKK